MQSIVAIRAVCYILGARGAIHVRGKDRVHPDVVRHIRRDMNSFLARHSGRGRFRHVLHAHGQERSS